MNTITKFFILPFLFLFSCAELSAQCEDACILNINNSNLTVDESLPIDMANAFLDGHIPYWHSSHSTPHLMYYEANGDCAPQGTYDPSTQNEILNNCLISTGISSIMYTEGIFTNFNFISNEYINYCIDLNLNSLTCPIINSNTDPAHLYIYAANGLTNSSAFTTYLPNTTPFDPNVPEGTGAEEIGFAQFFNLNPTTESFQFQPSIDYSQLQIYNAIDYQGTSWVSINNVDISCYTEALSDISFNNSGLITKFESSYIGTIPVDEYLWDFGDDNSSTDAAPFHVYDDYGPYTVCLNITDEIGCCAKVCESINILPPSISCAIDENTLFLDGDNPLCNSFSDLVDIGLYTSGGSLWGQTIVVKGAFTLDENFTFNGCTFNFEPGAELIVQSPGNIGIRYSTLQGCTQMWKGITVEGDIGNPNNRFVIELTTISDAYTALVLTDGSNIQQNYISFKNNYIGIYSSESGTLKNHFGSPVRNSTFTWDGTMLPEYNDQPEWEEKPFAGIFVNDLSHLDILENAIGKNTFDGITNGILASNCSISCRGSEFKNIADVNNSEHSSNLLSSSKGHAVGVVSSLPVDIDNNTFDDCKVGIRVFNSTYNNLTITNNIFTDDLMNPIDPNNMITVANCHNGIITINENETDGLFPAGINVIFVNGVEQLNVSHNKITTGSQQAIAFFNVHPMPNKYAFVIDNYINTTKAAFWTLGASNFSFEDNKINKDDPKSATGFRIMNTSNSHFRDNKMFYNGGGAGFSSNGSSYNLFCCNEINLPTFGFTFGGQSNPSILSTNTTTFDDEIPTQAEALWLNDAQIGPHTNKGNVWIGPWSHARIFAMNEDDETEIAQNSTFRTDFDITGLKPQFITPWGIEGWWIDINVAPPTCAATPDCDVDEYEFIPTNNPSEDACDDFRMYVEALIGPKLAGTFKDQNDWVLFYYAYNYLDDVPKEFWEDCFDILHFMDNIDNEIKVFNETDKAINRAYALSESENSLLGNESIALIDAKNDLEVIYNTLVTDEDYNTNQATIVSLQNTIINAVNQISQITSNAKSAGDNILTSLNQNISNISTTYVFQDLLLDVWKIKISTILNGPTGLTQTDLDDLTSIANSCILENGQAAYEARAILSSYFGHTAFLDIDNACASFKNRNVDDEEEIEITVFPNPSNGVFKISFGNESIEGAMIEISDVSGKSIVTLRNTDEVDLSNYGNGIYFIKMTLSDGTVFNQKLLLLR